MTPSTTPTLEFSINEIVLKAYHLAGLLNPAQGLDNPRGLNGRRTLDSIIQHIEAQSIQVRTVSLYNVALTAGTYKYTMPDNVLMVLDTAAYIPASATDLTKANGETPVSLMARDEWQVLSSHGATGLPSRYYVHREGTLVQLWLWPIPTEAGTLRVQAQLLLPSQQDGSNSTGLERPWAKYFIWALAHDLAAEGQRSLERVRYLRDEASKLFDTCKGFSNQRTGARAILRHPTGWSYR